MTPQSRPAFYYLDREHDDPDVVLGYAINRVLFHGADIASVRRRDTDAEVVRVERDHDGRGVSILPLDERNRP